MKNPFFLLCLFALTNCATISYDEDLLADGKTWRVKVKSSGSCSTYKASKDKVAWIKTTDRCLESMKTRLVELCGSDPERIFGCLESAKENSRSCYATCKM